MSAETALVYSFKPFFFRPRESSKELIEKPCRNDARNHGKLYCAPDCGYMDSAACFLEIPDDDANNERRFKRLAETYKKAGEHAV